MILAIFQARMTSTRLPGKTMAMIEGKPLLQHVIERVKASKLIDKIVVATSSNPKDDAVEEFVKKQGIDVFRGSGEDVLDRFYKAAKRYKADIVVRVTADDPFKDPVVTDEIIGFYIKNRNKYDYVSNTIKATYPVGIDIEVCSFKALERAWKEGKTREDREHVTYHIWNNPDKFRLKNVEYEKDLSHLRWTIDTQKDLDFARAVYRKLYKKKKVFLMGDILRLLKEHPELSRVGG